MTKKLRACGLLLPVIASGSVYGGDLKPFVGMELVSFRPDTPIDQRDAFWNLGVDYRMNSGLSGGVDIGLREQKIEDAGNSGVSLKTNLYAKYNWFAESLASPFVMAGYTTARFNGKSCMHSPTESESVPLSSDACEGRLSNTFGTTYGVGVTFRENRSNGSAFMVKYLRTTGVTDLEMNTLGVSFLY